MSSNDNNMDNGKILIQKRNTDKYILIEEEIRIINNEAILTEIPDKFMKVKILGMYEIDSDSYNSEFLKENEYKVDYNVGRVYFNSDRNDKVLKFKYSGTGIVLYPASRIYTRNKDNHIETFQEVLEKAQDSIEILGDLNTKLSEGKELYFNFNTSIKNCTELHNKLQKDIETGEVSFNKITQLLNESIIKEKNLSEINDRIDKNIEKLEDVITIADTKTGSLTTIVNEANEINTILNGNLSEGKNKINEITDKINEVEGILEETKKSNSSVNASEEIRKNNEVNRIASENERIKNEDVRRKQEELRQTNYKIMKETINEFSNCEAYSGEKEYKKFNRVVFNGSCYECIVENSLSIDPTNETNWICIARKGADGLGSGDMHTSIYDSNNNGVVDNAEKVNGFTVECNVPADAKFTDTIYDDTNIKNELGELNKKLINNETLDKKADLVNGKVPLEQLPNNIGNSFVELENVMVLTKDENIISINISQYNVSKDKIVVLLNGRELTIDKDFKVSNDNIHIENISDKILWKANDEIKIKILKNIPTELHELDVSLIPNNSINEDKLNKEFVKSINDKIKELTSLKADLVSGKIPLEQLPDNIGNSYVPFYNTIALEEDTTNIPIGISQFNADTDDLEVVDFNGRYLNKTEWKINDNKTSIDNISDEILWQKGDVFTFKVVKNISSEIPSIDVSLIPDGSIVKEKLNANFINEVNGKVDKVEGKGLSSNDFTNEDKNKLNGIENNANNYTHPSTHNVNMIDGVSEVGKTGNYNDLTNKPIIPTKTSELNNDSGFITQLTLFNAACTYDTNYILTIENSPTLPNYFTLRFKTPNNYIEGKTFNIGSDIYIPKNANFETNDIVSVEFDKVNKKCFFKVGGGSGVNETLPPQIENLNVISGNAKLNLTWTISDTTYLNGYIFTVKANSVPSNVNDGTKYEVDKSKTSYIISGLTNGTKYYIRPFPYNNKKQYQSEYVVRNGTPMNGILISSLPIGSKIKFGKYQVESETAQPIIWKIIDNNHYKDSDNPSIVDHVTLITEKIIDLRAFDAVEPNNSDSNRKQYGNNRYLYSNIRQWLNSNQINWFSKTHNADEPPTNSSTGNYGTGYDTKSGFLNLFSESEINNIIPTNLKVALNTVTDGGGSEIVNDKVFLLSETEVGLGNENGITEGKQFSIFSDNNSRSIGVTEQCFNNTKSSSKPSSQSDNWYWWLRTPYSSTSDYVRYVLSGGSLYYLTVRNGRYGIRPALNLKSNINVPLTLDIDGCYVVI